MFTTLDDKERKLVEMVQRALGEENVDYTMGRQDDPNQLPNPAPELNIPEGETNTIPSTTFLCKSTKS